MTTYDFTGDIHGEFDKLIGLLTSLDYQYRDGAYRHPERTAFFVGDFIDRGPQQVEVYRLVRAMIESGAARAVMGNHEFNAIAFATVDEATGESVRPRTGPYGPRNLRQHGEFLQQVGLDSALHREIIDWFRTLPLWAQTPEVRAVHACWHQPSIDHLTDAGYGVGPLTVEQTIALGVDGSPDFRAAEMILKGPELDLAGHPAFLDKDGIPRWRARFRWWLQGVYPLHEMVEIPHNALGQDGLPFPPLSSERIEAPRTFATTTTNDRSSLATTGAPVRRRLMLTTRSAWTTARSARASRSSPTGSPPANLSVTSISCGSPKRTSDRAEAVKSDGRGSHCAGHRDLWRSRWSRNLGLWSRHAIGTLGREGVPLA